MRIFFILPLAIFMVVSACQQEAGEKKEIASTTKATRDSGKTGHADNPHKTTAAEERRKGIPTAFREINDSLNSLPDSSFIEVNQWIKEFVFDMKYATSDNFLKEKVYDCPKCLLRAEVVRALLKATESLKAKKYKIKFFDCYRPLYIQKRMWEIVKDSRYVANPATGSVHNRGAAVDITLVDSSGKELDMGTKFDHFGNEAHHTYTNLTDTVLKNRKLLKETLEQSGFKALSSEWWHYSYATPKPYPLSNTPIVCP